MRRIMTTPSTSTAITVAAMSSFAILLSGATAHAQTNGTTAPAAPTATQAPAAPLAAAPATAAPATAAPATAAPATATPSASPALPAVSPKPKQDTKRASHDSAPADATAEDAPAVPSVHLEDPEPSQGHFIAVGFHGVGAMAFDQNRGTRSPTFGKGYTLRVGEALTDWLDLSLAFAFGSTSGDVDDTLSFGRFGLTTQWYLTERLFIQAGFGATNGQGKDPEDHKLSRGRYGDVYLTGIGTNLYISDNNQSGGWVLTPVLTAEVGPDSKFTSTALWLGVELSWWTGLDRDKLNLPLDKAYAKKKK